ncbi:YtcA family lipoprotein [Rhodobaculum claviforme]|uniref:Uncharacterized protein YtcA n=1 Tax=Rhodobaculum claviforme TaxID=1549854 RepID=A0A934TIY5_9RHOB|nr:YtcA family lipoprotein [Rhodobaculum claviforme]MBK5925863.1 hypothetical protein [Rhodobaculum claviforme]
MTARGLPLGVVLVALAGCSPAAHSPTVPVFGAYFPIWLIAAVLGILATVMMRLVFLRTGIDDRLPVPLLVYLFAAIKFSVGIWALWSGEMLLAQ